VDFAVHSYKDLPTAADPRLTLAAVPVREDPRDALVARDGMVLGELPTGSKVGTGSPRRAAQLRALGLGLEVWAARQRGHPESARSATVSWTRSCWPGPGWPGWWLDEITEVLDPLQMLPAPAQGALANRMSGR